MNPAFSDYINKFSNNLGLSGMNAFNNTIGWDPNKNALDQNWDKSAQLKSVYDNYANSVIKPNFQMNTYAPAADSFNANQGANNSYLMGNGSDTANRFQTGMNQQLNGQLSNAYNQFNDLAGKNYQNSLNSYMSDPTAFTNKNPFSTAPNTSMPSPTVTSNPQVQSPMPSSPQPQNVAGGWNPYHVVSGNTLSGIYQNRGYSGHMGYNDFINKVVQQNHLRNANSIYSGSTLQLPTY